MLRRAFLILSLGGMMAFAQDVEELNAQFDLVKALIPQATTAAVFWDPKANPDLDAILGEVSSHTGLRIIKTPLENIRDLSGLLRQVLQYNVSFFYLYDDRLCGTKNVIKFVVKSTLDKQIPVFSSSQDTLSGGGFGELSRQDGSWLIKINGNARDQLGIAVPADDPRFKITFN
jgi:ABC-type uncharacterized transport system substrate-binding protein